jgi:hypothetical protein
MSKRKLAEAFNASQLELMKALSENPEFVKVEHKKVINGQNPVRINLEERFDDKKPSAIVLMRDLKEKDLDISEIADLFYTAIVVDNNFINIKMNDILEDVQSGISKPNGAIITAVLDYTKHLKIMKNKIIDSPFINAKDLKEEFEKLGYDLSKLDKDNNSVQTLAKSAIMSKTDEDGNCKLTTTSEVVMHVLSSDCKNKLEEESMLFKSMYESLEEVRIAKRNRKVRNVLKR